MSDLTDLQRDYLAEIYLASQVKANGQDDLVTTSDLADRLFTSQSTVNRVIERLRERDLIEHLRYSGVRLVERGEREARAILRRQAIIETFLVNVMGFGWHEVYEEARRLRHNVSKPILDRMWTLAGSPKRSPFGELIDNTPPFTDELPLADAETAQAYTVVRVLTREVDRLEYLAALGLRPDTKLHLLHKAPFDGPIQIHLEREYRIIGYELAKMLTVTLADQDS